jgi:phytoene desaturase (3,4-didehydrolycopene-forming)
MISLVVSALKDEDCCPHDLWSYYFVPVFAPIGGFQAVVDSVERMANDLGVEMQCNTMVTSIRQNGVFVTEESSSSTPSTSTTPTFMPADLIIVNADRPYATKSLLSDDDSESLPKGPPTYDWDDQFSFSSGVIAFHWSIGKRLDDLNTHNVFMVAGSRSQAEASWEILRTNQGDVQRNTPFNFYVHRASKTDPTAAPEGCDSIMVLVPCRTLLRDEECAQLPREESLRRYREQFSETIVAEAREAVLARLSAVESLQNLDEWIMDEVVDTPATWADQFHLAAGTPFALVRSFFHKAHSFKVC